MDEEKIGWKEYLDEYRGLNLFYRAEHLIRDEFSGQKLEILQYCLQRESESKLVFKQEEVSAMLGKVWESSKLAI